MIKYLVEESGPVTIAGRWTLWDSILDKRGHQRILIRKESVEMFSECHPDVIRICNRIILFMIYAWRLC